MENRHRKRCSVSFVIKELQIKTTTLYTYWASQVALMIKNPAANVGDMGSILGSGRSPGKGNSNPLQDSCLGNLMNKRTWRATVHGVAESD